MRKQVDWWIRWVPENAAESEQLDNDMQQLNLARNEKGLLECRGCIQGDCQIYVLPSTLFAEKLVVDAHLSTLHGGVILTMTAGREKFWIPKLRRLLKHLVENCYGCRRYCAVSFPEPPTRNLPVDRTKASSRPFQVIGVDYAGPFMYKRKLSKSEGKVYLLLYGCSLTRAMHL